MTDTAPAGDSAAAAETTADTDPHRFPGHHVSDANDHAKQAGDGRFAPIMPQPAPKRTMTRRIRVTQRAPVLPDHHGQTRIKLRGAH